MACIWIRREGSLSLRGTDLMGQGTVYVPVKSGVEASILVHRL